ncbi:hypothetical protein H6G45_05000 [Synechocystis sp. FACHB-383]|uniref:hypothetical protein n=1 Tax=Synechocystis sp. FACHB-383 TaxID=2692864 RepID=UPI001689EEAF|nr:hypothetical protein [Synechocystis sp. FACHB-383]MBD2652862.1 hypothetical protein [Synechocystis sp. FACHB-383]
MKFIASSLTILFFLALPIPAKGNDSWTFSPVKVSNETCQDAIDGVKSYLVKNKYFIPWKWEGGTVYPSVKLNDSNIREYYFDYPQERQSNLIFKLSGDFDKLYQGFLSSPQLMSDLAARIMGACPQIGLIDYNHWWEGGVPVGYFPDGTARTFIYTDFDSEFVRTTTNTTKFKWGYYFSP